MIFAPFLRKKQTLCSTFFWQCKVTSQFWGTFFQWPQSSSLIQQPSCHDHRLGVEPRQFKYKSANTFLMSQLFTISAPFEITYEIEQTDSTSSLKNGNLSLATFNGLRAQKFAKLKSRALSVILPT